MSNNKKFNFIFIAQDEFESKLWIKSVILAVRMLVAEW